MQYWLSVAGASWLQQSGQGTELKHYHRPQHLDGSQAGPRTSSTERQKITTHMRSTTESGMYQRQHPSPKWSHSPNPLKPNTEPTTA
jgi:hypothetical protein